MRGVEMRTARAVTAVAWVGLVCGISACGDEVAGAGLVAPLATIVEGQVTRGSGWPVNGATVQVGDARSVTLSDGWYRFEGVPTGPVTMRVSRPGFNSDSTTLHVQPGVNTRHVVLTRPTVFEFGPYALYVPFPLNTYNDRVNAVIVALGGPDTRAFGTGKPFGAPSPTVEAALQVMGAGLRDLSEQFGLAILGTSTAALPNTVASDAAILAAIDSAGVLTHRGELGNAPILLYGLSGGGPEATGLVARRRTRSLGAFLKVPVALEPWTPADSLTPAFVMLAEQDAFVDNIRITTEVQARRKAGALWGTTVEKGAIHHSLSLAQRALTLAWMSDLLIATFSRDCFGRIYGSPIPPSPSGGYLGESATGAVQQWAVVPPDERSRYGWFPGWESAAQWRSISSPASTAPLAPAPLSAPCADG